MTLRSMLKLHNGVASNAVSFSGIVTNLNNNESNSIYLSANVSTFFAQDMNINL